MADQELRLFVDGRGTTPQPLKFDGQTGEQELTGLIFGAAFHGSIDNVRVSRTARYHADFVPTDRLNSDAETLAYFDFAEGGGNELKDSSGNNHHGKIVGAKWVKAAPVRSSRGLIAHWTFDGISGAAAPDSSGHNHHATVQGAITAPGKFNSALKFDGDDDAVSFPKLGTADDFTYSLWVKHDADVLAGKTIVALVANDGWSKPGDIHFEYTVGRRLMAAWFADGGEQVIHPAGFDWSSIAGQWAHLAVVYQADRRAFDFYVNGRRYPGDGTVRAVTRFELGPGRIGHWDPQDHPEKASRGFRGLIDDVRIYDRALPQSEIDALAGTATSATVTPPPAKAPFDAKQARAHQEAWAKHLGTTVETTNSVGAKMILIPPGGFLMGSSDEEVAAALKAADEIAAGQDVKDRIQNVERPQHKVVISQPFLMSATEVTIGQFKKFTASGYQTDAEKAGESKTYLNPGHPVTDESPAAMMTWNDAAAYCQWLSEQEKRTYRLPTEAEWEYACRAGTTAQFSFGDETHALPKYGRHDKNAEGKSHPVGTLLPNNFGLFDMHGNLWEWCGDYWDARWYENASSNDQAGPSAGSDRVLRGGSWSNSASYSRSAYRGATSPLQRYENYGFRVVRVLDDRFFTSDLSLNKPWTDWLSPKLKQSDFFAEFDGRQGWQREGNAITTTNVISGQAVLPDNTRNGAVRLTYLLRDANGIQINARDRKTDGMRELYMAEDTGKQLGIVLLRPGSPYHYLAKQEIPATIPKDAPRTLEFRVVGDTLTAAVNGSVVVTAKDATVPDGNFALVALKGVLVQKVEYQELDEPPRP
jgi:formylglycine-generating enzyme required for sulfatase activity